MPHKDTHDIRLRDPGAFKAIRRQNDRFGPGIDVTWGVEKGKGGKAVIQSLHFDKEKFSFDDAKAWARKHDYAPLNVIKARDVSEEAPTTTTSDIATFAQKAGLPMEKHPLFAKIAKQIAKKDKVSDKEYVLKLVREEEDELLPDTRPEQKWTYTQKNSGYKPDVDQLGTFWVVLSPSGMSTLEDVLMSADLGRMFLQIKGGLPVADIIGVFKDEKTATDFAKAQIAKDEEDFAAKDGDFKDI